MISIVTPTLNGAKFIELNIKSISELKIPFEHIIVDGGSTDGTLEIIRGYPHINLLHQTGKTGMYGAIHQGFLKSNGKYLAYVNADDIIIPSGFEAMYNYITSEGADVIYSDSILMYFNSNKTVTNYGNRFGRFFLKRGIIPFIQPSSIFTREIYFESDGVNYEKFRICGDLDLFLRFANLTGKRFLYIRQVSSRFLVRDDSLGNSNSEVVIQEKLLNNLPIPTLLSRVLFKVSNIL